MLWQTYNPAGLVILGLHSRGEIEFRARSFRTPLLDQTILIPPSHLFSVLHFLFVSRLRSVPSVLSANETLLQVGEPTVELALDGLSFGRLAGVHRQAVTEAFEGSVHAHQSLHFVEGDGCVTRGVLGLHGPGLLRRERQRQRPPRRGVFSRLRGDNVCHSRLSSGGRRKHGRGGDRFRWYFNFLPHGRDGLI